MLGKDVNMKMVVLCIHRSGSEMLMVGDWRGNSSFAIFSTTFWPNHKDVQIFLL